MTLVARFIVSDVIDVSYTHVGMHFKKIWQPFKISPNCQIIIKDLYLASVRYYNGSEKSTHVHVPLWPLTCCPVRYETSFNWNSANHNID